MKLTLALFALLAGSNAHADSSSAIVHVGLSDGGQYDVTVARDGMPTTLMVRDGSDAVEIHLRFADAGKLRYDIKRSGNRPFSLEGETVPPRGRPALLGHLPFGRNACDVLLRATDD
ncbi:MAG TPA: hypothetical protein VN947_01215 [Polyangia bacterium]|nr:hypothetical protein [Polyangia bacterium]